MNDTYDSLIKAYQSAKKSNASAEDMISILLKLSEVSNEEQLLFELALWYWKAGYPARAKRICKKIKMSLGSDEWIEKTNEVIEFINSDIDLPIELERKYLVCQDEPVAIVKPDEPVIITEMFEDIIGLKAVKEKMLDIYQVVQLQKTRERYLHIQNTEKTGCHFVFYGNPGTGKTEVARRIGKLLYKMGVNEKDTFIEVDRKNLVSEYVGQTAKNVEEILKKANGGTLFIDEAYNLYKAGDSKDFGEEAIDTLLKHMEDHQGEYTVIIAGYKQPMEEMLKNANKGFRSRFGYHLYFPDYTDDELLEIADTLAKKRHYIIEEQGYNALRKRIEKERIDETFGNARFIRAVLKEAEENLARRIALIKNPSITDLSVIRAEDILPESGNEKTLEQLLDELNNLIGLQTAKTHIAEMMNVTIYDKEYEKRGISDKKKTDTLHMAFMGNPGTGKTTVARLYGKILSQLGILKRDDVFIEVHREDLIGQYQGHTAKKVREVISSALGGVLFIDEAYSLVTNENDSFGLEAVNALVAEIDNHRDALIVILAGYTDSLDQFLKNNPGLTSRIPNRIYFDDYSVDEMVQIFLMMTKARGFILSDGLIPVITQSIEIECKQEDFGNARGIRNMFEAVCRKQNSRIAKRLTNKEEISDSEFVTILLEDLSTI